MTSSQQTIGIIGSGPAALVTAQILIKDGFHNVQLITRDSSPGGIWAKEKVYPDLLLNKWISHTH
jgi:dimethylaniline monooxygenase (N-oxide forming)